MTHPLTAAEWDELQLRETLAGADAVLSFVPYLTPKFSAPAHLRVIADLFSRSERQPVRALVSTPPRHSKTETVIHSLAWWLRRHPDKTAAYISYSADLAFSKARRIRDLARKAGVIIRDGQSGVAEWRTPDGGGVLAGGIGGPLNGQGVDLMLIDDPLKNREEAESPTIREKNHDWFTSTAMTRIEPGGSVVIVHTRWHPDDLIGTLARDPEVPWEVINLPAIDEHGIALWPERWSAEALDIRRREVGEYDWSSLYMGQPTLRGKSVFHEPQTYQRPRVQQCLFLVACDPAATASTKADSSAILVASMWLEDDGLPYMDVLDGRSLQVEIPALVRELVGVQRAWSSPTQVCPVAIEAVGGFKSVGSTLRQVDARLRVIEISPVGDKFVRAQPVAAAWNDGRVRIPESAPWVASFKAQVMAFTGVGDKHDDWVDALAHCWNTLSAMLRRRPTGYAAERVASALPMG